ncbi:MAG TPA: amino acid ABC transporter permease [Candidatus Limnocylindrales bacterium]|nr:amino acid ABC transporter permease [Candidatus Limnocylindrales bacterium]
MTDLPGWLAILAGGLVVTIGLTAATGVLAVIWSGLLATASISPWRWLRGTARLYADIFRSIPLLALLIFVYFGLGPYASKLGVSSFWLAVLALTLSESSYMAEVYRGALQSIPGSQWEAALSLGLSWPATVRLVVLPQALLPAIPSTVNALIATLKDSSLASLIAVNEVTQTATILVSDTFLPLQVYTVLGALYFVLIAPLSYVSKRLEAMLGSQFGVRARTGAVALQPVADARV